MHSSPSGDCTYLGSITIHKTIIWFKHFSESKKHFAAERFKTGLECNYTFSYVDKANKKGPRVGGLWKT